MVLPVLVLWNLSVIHQQMQVGQAGIAVVWDPPWVMKASNGCMNCCGCYSTAEAAAAGIIFLSVIFQH
jgi:hypothetical protein